MMWNRKKLMKFGKGKGFAGKTGADFVAWAEEAGYEFDGIKDASELETVFNKTVTISYDETDDVVVNPPAEVAEGDLEDEEVKMEDEEDEQMKQFRKWQKSQQRGQQKGGHGSPSLRSDLNVPGQGKRFGDRISQQKSAYDAKIRSGGLINVNGFGRVSPLFGDASRAEYFGAKSRLIAMKSEDYSQKSNDMDILSRFKGSTLNNSTGGALVFYEELPELIENLDDHGAFEEAVGVTSMRDGEQTVSKLTADVTVYDTAEGAAATASDPTFGNVKLVAEKTTALVKQTRELLDDSAFNIAEIIARSSKRAMNQWVDEGAVLGSNNRQGILDILVSGGANVYDTNSAGWGNITIDEIQEMQALAPSWVYKDPKCGFMCTMAFAQSVFYRFGLSAGGNTGREISAGFLGMSFNGFPVYLCESMQATYSDGTIPLLFGAWSNSCKYGLVRGSQEMRSSSDRYFDEDKIAFRYDQRWAHSLHGVKATGQSGIVGLEA
jgi:HK97 family phage major capsid protein